MAHNEDHIALSVGKIILAFGRLDQAIWGSLGRTDWLLEEPASEIDNRFSHRLKHLRVIVTGYYGDKSPQACEYDKLQTRIKNLEKIRSQFAHGYVTATGGVVKISDQRNLQDYRKAHAALCELRGSQDDFKELFQRHMVIEYQTKELETLPNAIDKAAAELENFILQISLALGELAIEKLRNS